MALAAYNAGLTQGRRVGQEGRATSGATIEFPETRHYVLKVMRGKERYRGAPPGRLRQVDGTAALNQNRFRVVSPFEPAGDQPEAIEQLVRGLDEGLRYQTLLGVTGSGKTFTMAKVIERVQKPTLVMAPNKTLAAQLASEIKDFLPDNAVVYFVSYYDYYQPEAYVPSTDTFIEKDASINAEVEKLRHAATAALLSRKDVVVVASVSCIYGIGSPEDYAGMAVFLGKGKAYDRDELIRDLIEIQYDRNDYELQRGNFRVRGDVLDVFPPYADHPVRVEFFGDEIEAVAEVDQLTGEVLTTFDELPVWPATHYVTERTKLKAAIGTIQEELRVAARRAEGRRQAARGAAARDARELRPRDARDDGLHERHRELLAAPRRPSARRAREHAHRLLRRRLPHDHRREPRHGSADPRHARRATAAARSRSWSTGSGFRARSTTGRCASTSSRRACRSSSTSRRLPVTTSSA